MKRILIDITPMRLGELHSGFMVEARGPEQIRSLNSFWIYHVSIEEEVDHESILQLSRVVTTRDPRN